MQANAKSIDSKSDCKFELLVISFNIVNTDAINMTKN